MVTMAPFFPSPLAPGEPVNVAPFGTLLPEGNGIVWEDPREIHRVVVRFKGPALPTHRLRLEYWGSRWPAQRLPKDRQPGGGDVGWWELGNWYRGGWRAADAIAVSQGSVITFTFRPVNAREFPELKDYPATFRTTLKIRIAADEPLPEIEGIEAYTDSVWERRVVRLAWDKAPQDEVKLEVFNGVVDGLDRCSSHHFQMRLWAAANPDPNTFDRTLVTVRGPRAFTFAVDDLAQRPLFLPPFGVAVLDGEDERDYAAVVAAQAARGEKTLYDRVALLPEQTWKAAWEGMPAKRKPLYLPLGLDGGRQRFRLDADGSVTYRINSHQLRYRPGKDSPRIEQDGVPLRCWFGMSCHPVIRTIEEGCLPIAQTTWEEEGVRVQQTAFVTALSGTQTDGPPPPGDAFAVLLARFTFINPTQTARIAALRLRCEAGDHPEALRADAGGRLWSGERLRGQIVADGAPVAEQGALHWSWELAPGQSREAVVKLPYVLLTEAAEHVALAQLDFAHEHAAVAGYWRRRLDQSMRLITPEPMLNEFHRAHAAHLLINCEREPDSERRFARVGSFGYGAYGNESCMMVVNLDRRGYHTEARQCLDAWLRYQGTAELPGDFSSKEGVLYGAGGYEAGGYNQHHGWILWCLAEHYRFTRDTDWLRRAAPGILAGAEWVIRERQRTAGRADLGRGLLPAGSLEDIGDWWPWLSTNCYTWRGLDAAAWALAQIQHPEAGRLRQEAEDYHAALLAAFREAARRAPVVRLRDGTAVPHIPSHVYRRGRSFGWVCETLEGALHLLISRVIDPHSPEAEWIVKDYEDNLYLSHQWGYTLDDFEAHWFGRGGMSMQSCLLLDVEPYLYRDDVKHALRALFNAIAVGYFPDVRMITEHALPNMGDWRGDHYKSSDESNAAGWLRQIFAREAGEELLLGQAVPREWLRAGQRCGVERAATHFGPMSLIYEAGEEQITARLEAPRRDPPRSIRLRFREPGGRPLASVTVSGQRWTDFQGEWVRLPGDIGATTVVVHWRER
ncbi:MAG: hypothetical protein HY320_10040 [Armatimonadetes bacterium]|nr:hypothetical protein [Armatimonadota bacterium]